MHEYNRLVDDLCRLAQLASKTRGRKDWTRFVTHLDRGLAELGERAAELNEQVIQCEAWEVVPVLAPQNRN